MQPLLGVYIRQSMGYHQTVVQGALCFRLAGGSMRDFRFPLVAARSSFGSLGGQIILFVMAGTSHWTVAPDAWGTNHPQAGGLMTEQLSWKERAVVIVAISVPTLVGILILILKASG